MGTNGPKRAKRGVNMPILNNNRTIALNKITFIVFIWVTLCAPTLVNEHRKTWTKTSKQKVIEWSEMFHNYIIRITMVRETFQFLFSKIGENYF